MVIKIGVLELQGGYALHHNLLKKIGLNSLPVKSGDDLKQSDGLIIPGGESTTLSLLIRKYSLREPIIEFAKTSELKIIAEGVETAEQVEYLKEHQVYYIQGYVYAKPMSYEAFSKSISGQYHK